MGKRYDVPDEYMIPVGQRLTRETGSVVAAREISRHSDH